MINYIGSLVFILITWTFLSCTKEPVEHIFEEKIFVSLLPDLVNKVYKDPKVYINPPIPNRTSHNPDTSIHRSILSINSIIDYKTDKENKQTTVLISNMIKPVSNEDTASINSLIKSNDLKISISQNQPPYKLNLPTFPHKQYNLKTFAEFSLQENQVMSNGKRVYHVGIAFSRIQFDKNKEIGILTGTYLCQPRCGIGYVIIIHKTTTGWKIKEVIPTWVS